VKAEVSNAVMSHEAWCTGCTRSLTYVFLLTYLRAWKAASPMLSREAGSVSSTKEMAPAKAQSPRALRAVGRVTRCNEVQPAKAQSPMSVRLAAKVSSWVGLGLELGLGLDPTLRVRVRR
jgi:hypothetical protein